MYKETKTINGIEYHRGTPNGDWIITNPVVRELAECLMDVTNDYGVFLPNSVNMHNTKLAHKVYFPLKSN